MRGADRSNASRTGAAQATNGGVANTGIAGDITTVTVHVYPRAEPSWPFRLGALPLEADCYLSRVAAHGLTAGTGVCTVVSGLGGVGKTQLVANYATAVWRAEEIDFLIWINAGARSGITAAYAQAAAAVTGIGTADAEQAADRFLAWLACTDKRWLVVLDDLVDAGAARGLWPPMTPHGQSIVTTRRRDAALMFGRRLVELDVFTPDESQAYLAAKLSGRPELAEGAVGLGEDLGHLPLALAQAMAYIVDRDLTCSEYRERLSERRRLADVLPEPGSLPDDHQRTVDATWSLSIELADSLSPSGLARPTLALASLLDANGIPEDVFGSDAAMRWLRAGGSHPDAATDVYDALRCLQRLSLASISRDAELRLVRVHALVQRAAREHLDRAQLQRVVRAAADALLERWPEGTRDLALLQSMCSNTLALAGHRSVSLWHPGGHPVLFRAGGALGSMGQVAAAAEYFDGLMKTATTNLGPEHPDTLSALHSFAWWRGRVGDEAGAVVVLEALLLAIQRNLGAQHPLALAVRHSLAYLYGEQGDAARAVAEFAALLVDREFLLGTDHLETLNNRHALAWWRGAAGDAALAVSSLGELFEQVRSAYGPEHPQTLAVLHSLIRWRGELGDYAGAIRATRQLLAARIRILGDDHPDTFNTRNNLGRWQGESGEIPHAVATFALLLADRERVLGAEHPDSVNTRLHLARWRAEAGDAKAIGDLQRAVADLARLLGNDHPDAVVAREVLGRCVRLPETPDEVV